MTILTSFYLIFDQSERNSIRGKILIENEVAYLLDPRLGPSLEMIAEKLKEFSPVKCRKIINYYAQKWLNGEPC